MKTIYLLILIVLIMIPVSFGILFTIKVPYYELEISGMMDTYNIGETYSFYYTIEGFGNTCGVWMAYYPDIAGEIKQEGEVVDCSSPTNKELSYDSRKDWRFFISQVPQIPGMYNVTVDIGKVKPAIFEFTVLPDTENKQPLVINVTRGTPLVILDEESKNKSLEEYSVKELLEKPHLIPVRDSHENHVSLYSDMDKSVYSCASVSLERIADDQLHYYLKENQTSPHFFSMTEEELDTHPELKLLIAASNLLEFPYNDRVHVNFDGVDFVEYEFYFADKAIEKYGDSRSDYFMYLDSNYEFRLTDPGKQGFTNHFDAPDIIYDGKIYDVGGTYFWTSDESNLRMHLVLKDSIDEEKKFIELTDEDMIQIPKIKEALNGMQKVQENIHANIGLPENPDWNDYRDWYGNKMTDDMKNDKDYGNEFSGFTFDGQFYELSFPIC